jgi:hypothetical protein
MMNLYSVVSALKYFPQRREGAKKREKGKGKRDEGTRDLRLEARGSEFVGVDL